MHPQIDISPDPARPEGGHAAILIRSVTTLPDNLKFSISAIPDDPDEPQSSAEWTLGLHDPLAAELTPEGLVLRIGPALVDRPELQPGTPVVFRLADADISAELSWPDLPITIPGKLPNPVIDASNLRARRLEDNHRKAAAAIAAKADEINAALAAKESPAKAKIANQTEQPSTTLHKEPAPRQPASVHKLTAISSAPETATAAAPHVKGQQANASPRAPKPAIPVAAASPVRNRADIKAAAPRAIYAPKPDLMAAVNAGDTAERNWMKRTWLGIALAVLALPVMLYALWPSIPSSATATGNALRQLANSDWVTRILAVGNLSPSGFDASNVSADEALKRAERAIFENGGQPNLEERKFWLRKSITLLLGEPESRWAITQLGALQTGPTETRQKPDYSAAKSLWEVASASGDTVATCFLSQLYELGLGVAPNEEQARKWQERAAAQGGCNLQLQRSAPALTN